MESSEIVQTMDDIARVAVTPEQHRRGLVGRDKPPEQFGSVRRLKDDVLERKAGKPGPIPVNPRGGMIDEKLIEEVVRRRGLRR